MGKISVSILLSYLLIVLSVTPVTAVEHSDRQSQDLDAGPGEISTSFELHLHEELVEIKQRRNSRLAPFTTDGCSGGLSAGWQYLTDHIDHIKEVHGATPPWESCCVEHDLVYHSAGEPEMSASQSLAARNAADLELRQCVIDTGIRHSPELSVVYGVSESTLDSVYRAVAELMYRAVRMGGVPCSGLPWRWGYGWDQCE